MQQQIKGPRGLVNNIPPPLTPERGRKGGRQIDKKHNIGSHSRGSIPETGCKVRERISSETSKREANRQTA